MKRISLITKSTKWTTKTCQGSPHSASGRGHHNRRQEAYRRGENVGRDQGRLSPFVIRTISRINGLGTEDKYTITAVSKGNANYYITGFIINGVLPKEGGYLCTLSKDGFTLSWSHPIDSLLSNFKHLQPIMGQDYFESHTRVQALTSTCK